MSEKENMVEKDRSQGLQHSIEKSPQFQDISAAKDRVDYSAPVSDSTKAFVSSFAKRMDLLVEFFFMSFNISSLSTLGPCCVNLKDFCCLMEVPRSDLTDGRLGRMSVSSSRHPWTVAFFHVFRSVLLFHPPELWSSREGSSPSSSSSVISSTFKTSISLVHLRSLCFDNAQPS